MGNICSSRIPLPSKGIRPPVASPPGPRSSVRIRAADFYSEGRRFESSRGGQHLGPGLVIQHRAGMLPAQIGTEGVKMTRTVTRLQGSLMVLASGVMFSFGALTFRALVEADAWQYLFYRGLSAGLVAALVIVMVGRIPIRSVAEA